MGHQRIAGSPGRARPGDSRSARHFILERSLL